MKGIIFTELLEMIEGKYGYDVVDEVLEKCNLKSKGAYTSVGTYDDIELHELMNQISSTTNTDKKDIMTELGQHLFHYFNRNHKVFLEGYDNAFDFFLSIEDQIHVEVKKLYPTAELPSVKARLIDSNQLEIHYLSKRKMAHFAHGLIKSSLDYYGEDCTVQITSLKEDMSDVMISISRNLD